MWSDTVLPTSSDSYDLDLSQFCNQLRELINYLIYSEANLTILKIGPSQDVIAHDLTVVPGDGGHPLSTLAAHVRLWTIELVLVTGKCLMKEMVSWYCWSEVSL